jgi:HEAT repeat protein
MPLFGPPNVEDLQAKGKLKPLLKALHYKEDAEIRRQAVVALGALRDGAAAEPLVAVLQGREFRLEAATALGDIGDVRAVEALLVALHDADPAVRAAAATALGKIGDGRAVQPLVEAFQDREETVRQAAIDALAVMGAQNEGLLLDALVDDSKPIRQGALAALEGHGYAPRPDALGARYWIAKQQWDKVVEIGWAAVEPLIAAVADDDLAAGAAGALGRIGDARALPALLPLVAHANEAVRLATVNALSVLAQPEALPSLIVALSDKAETVRKAAAEALVKQPDASALPALITASRDAYWAVRIAAIEALGLIGAAAAAPPIAAALADEHPQVYGKAEQVAKGLTGEAEPALIEALLETLLHTEARVRGRAAKALDEHAWQPTPDVYGAAHYAARREWDSAAALGAPAIPALTMLLADGFTRAQATDALVAIGEPAVEPLIAMLTDPRPEARISAADALGRLGDARAVAPIIAMLAEALPLTTPEQEAELKPVHRRLRQNTQDACVKALGQLGAPSVAPLLGLLHSEPDGSLLRQAAVLALAAVGEPAVAPLIALLPDPDLGALASQALVEAGGQAVPSLVEALANPALAEGTATTLARLQGDALERLVALAQALPPAEAERLWQTAVRMEDAKRYVALAAVLPLAPHAPSPADGGLIGQLLHHRAATRAETLQALESDDSALEEDAPALRAAYLASARVAEALALSTEQAEAAATACREALRLAPRFSGAYVAIANRYRLAGRTDLAVGWALQALALVDEDAALGAEDGETGESDNPYAWIELGLARADLGDAAGAAAAFAAATLVDPDLDDTTPWLRLLDFYARLGELEALYAARERALALGATLEERDPAWINLLAQTEVSALRAVMDSLHEE